MEEAGFRFRSWIQTLDSADMVVQVYQLYGQGFLTKFQALEWLGIDQTELAADAQLTKLTNVFSNETGNDVTVPLIAGGVLLAIGMGALYLSRKRYL